MPTNATAVKEYNLITAQIKKYVAPISKFLDLKISLREYSRRLYDFKAPSIHTKRQQIITEIIKKRFRALLGPDAEQRYRIALPDQLACNIVDHHQILNHPLLISSNIIGNADKIAADAPQDAVIVIASGDTPPNNYFSKSGFQLHGKRIPLFSVSEREYCSYYLPVRKLDFLDRLHAIGRWNAFSSEEQRFLDRYQAFVNAIDVSSCANYLDQITLVVQQTWPLLFEKSIRGTLPSLLYIPQEQLVSEWLIRSLKDPSFITAALFNPDIRQRVLENFRGIVVAWNEKINKGTHFFWRKHPDEPKSMRMYLQGDILVPQDPRMAHLSVPLDADTLIDLLRRREIYPSLFLIFSVLNFYSGIKPLAGYGSVVYLSLFKKAWMKTLERTEYSDEIPHIESVDTDGFIGGVPLFFKRDGDRLTTQYAADLIFDGGVTREYLEKMYALPFKDLFSIGIADVYDYYSGYYIPEKERVHPTISFDDLAALTLPWL